MKLVDKRLAYFNQHNSCIVLYIVKLLRLDCAVTFLISKMAANKGKKGATAAVEIPECPVCMESMTAPIFLCQSGHSLCAACTRVLSPPTCPMCPVCRQPMTQMRNRTLEDIINSAKVPCPNREAGCTYTLAGAGVADHLRQCIFRELECPLGAVLGRCSWTGQLKQMMDHFKERHPVEFSGGAEADLELSNVTLRECDRRVYLATLHRLLFVVTVKVDSLQRMAYWTIQLIGPKVLAHQHIYEIHVISMRNPVRKVVFTEHCLGDDMKTDDVIRQSNCAIMPFDMLVHFMKDNKLSFKYFIKKYSSELGSKPEERAEVPNENNPRAPRSTSCPRRGRGGGPRGGQKGYWQKGSGQQESGKNKAATHS